MGMFVEADRHPFDSYVMEAAEHQVGGAGSEAWSEELPRHDLPRRVEPEMSRLWIRQDRRD